MTPIMPPATLGVLGGGQLGRLFAGAAQRMGYRVATVDPDRDAPAHQVADLPIVARYDDPDALDRLAAQCAAVTVEFESIPASSMQRLAQRCRVAPGADAVAIAQDRLREKRFLRAIGLPVAPFIEILSERDLLRAGCYPGILKRARNGYDGIGQRRVETAREALEAWDAFERAPCVLERLVPLERELSVILVRAASGEARSFPVAENRHRDGILELSVAPSTAPRALLAHADAAAARIAQCLDYIGVLGVEFFVSQGALLVNEFAPRPHNSGHFTIEACATSQFEQQVRALCGVPLGDTTQRRPAAMANILGDSWGGGESGLGWLRARPDTTLHLYGKRESRPRRKMGHVTILADSTAEAAASAESVLRLLKRAPAHAAQPLPNDILAPA